MEVCQYVLVFLKIRLSVHLILKRLPMDYIGMYMVTSMI